MFCILTFKSSAHTKQWASLYYITLHLTLSVAKLTSRQWYMSDWVRNISAMSLTGNIEARLDLFYFLLVVLKQGDSVTEGSQPTENEKSQIKNCWKLPKGVTAKILKTKERMYSEKTLSERHVFHHKFHTAWLRTEPASPRREAWAMQQIC